MPQAVYRIENGPMVTTAAPVKVTTGTAIKTMLQLAPTTLPISVIEWGISFDGIALATPIECELLTTGTIFATVTASAAADIVNLSDPSGTAPSLTLSTTGTGYASSAEGTIVATRELDFQLVQPLTQYLKQYPLGQESNIIPGQSLRIRVTAAAAVNAYCYIVFTQG